MTYFSHLTALLKRHQAGFVLSILLAASLIAIAVTQNALSKTVTYLAVMALGFLLSEFIFFTGKLNFKPWRIRSPKSELLVIFLVILLSSLLFVYWFLMVDQEQVGRMVGMVTMGLRLLFVFPIFLLFYFLVLKRYRLKELGFWNFNYWFVSVPLIILIGGVAYLAFPEGIQFESEFKRSGIQGFIVLGLFTAAIPEEVARNLFQSRLGHVINSKAAAWFIVSFIWAVQHIPVFTFQSNGSYYEAAIGALGILPIGLLWGYLNERYKSIIPSVLIHSTNLWGLQNIF